ncbi:MAG: hypothetical protein PHQ28_09975 [Mycobacterium sp.]|nr:hypothetical protein [Mycobacterium sp.]
MQDLTVEVNQGEVVLETETTHGKTPTTDGGIAATALALQPFTSLGARGHFARSARSPGQA